MRVLELVTAIVFGTLLGVEFAVSAFINPALWKSGDQKVTVALAQTLGRVMPFWYIATFLLTVAVAAVRWRTAQFANVAAAVVLWVLVIVFTLTLLVPLNNQVARGKTGDADTEWLRIHRTWDLRHRVRVAALATAFGLLIWSGVAG